MSTIRLLVVALCTLAASAAHALEAIPVPWVATDPTVPHLAYNGHATTFKAIARGGNGSYLYDWDFEGDGVYDFSAVTSNRYDLSTRFTYPPQAADVTFLARVRVTSNSEVTWGTYPVRVFADVPVSPAAADDRQLQIMRSVAIDDGLWYLHRQMSRVGDEAHPLTGAQITGSLGAIPVISTASFLEALGHNLHYPAFPAAYLGALPDPGANAARWAKDPYAEDAARLLNFLLTQASLASVAAADEANLVGFWPETSATPIPGTDDGLGVYIGYNTSDQTTGPHSNALRAIAVSNLTGFVAQVGDANRILGRRFEFIAQQMVDALVWAQNDGGAYPGSWFYYPNGGSDMLGEYAGGTLDAVEALWEAERSLGPHGVIVPNLVKTRNTSYILQNINSCPAGGLGGSYVASYNAICDLGYSPAILFSLAWVGANGNSAADTRIAFPFYAGTTRGQLRTQFDGSLLWISTVFNAVTPSSIGWDNGFVEGADFDRADGRGDHWAMLHWTRAARAVIPEIVLYGTNDHARLFARYLLANQGTDGGWSWTASGVLNNWNDNALGPHGRAAWALLTLSRAGMVPTALANASATSVAVGTPVTFTGAAFAGDATYLWELGNGVTHAGEVFDYAYPTDGVFPVTLVVTTRAGTSTATLTVTVNPEDADADGLPDAWEVLHFGATTAQTGAGDPDADGLTNAEEWAVGLDPATWDGPGVPTLLAPTCASKVTTAQPTLLVGNAVHPTGAPLTYEFELYGDAAMTVSVTAGRDVPAGAGFTAWQVDVPLTEDATYYWRARARSGAVFGDWTSSSCALGIDALAPPPAETPADPGGCGCSGAGGNPTAALGGVLAVLLRRRQRGQSQPKTPAMANA